MIVRRTDVQHRNWYCRVTRHIPVRVASVSDDAQSALSLGAVGYMLKPITRMLKPITRAKLVQALEQLETRLAQRMRRVLVVEDDAAQLASIQLLLGSRDVESVAVERLKVAIPEFAAA
jgi:CheY-like chemotaxis protein